MQPPPAICAPPPSAPTPQSSSVEGSRVIDPPPSLPPAGAHMGLVLRWQQGDSTQMRPRQRPLVNAAAACSHEKWGG